MRPELKQQGARRHDQQEVDEVAPDIAKGADKPENERTSEKDPEHAVSSEFALHSSLEAEYASPSLRGVNGPLRRGYV